MDLNAISSWNSVEADLYKLFEKNQKLKQLNRKLARQNTELKMQVKDFSGDAVLQDGVDPCVQRKLLTVAVFLYRMTKRFLKGFCVGYGLRALFATLPFLLKSRGSKDTWRLWLLKLYRILSSAPVRYGMLIGSSICIFETSMQQTRRLFRDFAFPQLRTLFCGCLTGPAMLFLPPEDRAGFSLFVGIRGLGVAANYLVAMKLVPQIPHADTLVMCAASAQAIWAWIHNPKSHDPAYNRFLDYQGGKRMPQVAWFARYHENRTPNLMAAPVTEAMNASRSKLNLPPLTSLPNTHRVVMFDGLSFLHNHARFFVEGIKRSLPVYIPVYGISTLLFRSGALLRSPLVVARQFVSNVVRSAVFLSAYCMSCWLGADAAELVLGPNPAVSIFAGIAGGSCVLIERRNRRIELGLYVLSHALKSGYRSWVEWGWIKGLPSPLTEVVCYGLGIALLMHAYVNNHSLTRKTYISLFKYFFGPDSVHHFRKVVSTQDQVGTENNQEEIIDTDDDEPDK